MKNVGRSHLTQQHTHSITLYTLTQADIICSTTFVTKTKYILLRKRSTTIAAPSCQKKYATSLQNVKSRPLHQLATIEWANKNRPL